MSALELLSKKELRELLCKGWMTHDAMWLLHCLESIGMEKTNEINSKAVFSMSRIEINRISKALGYPKKDKIKTFEEVKQLFVQAMEIVKADFMDFTWSIPGKNVLHWKWRNGNCNMATHLKAKSKKGNGRINPLKASKRGNQNA